MNRAIVPALLLGVACLTPVAHGQTAFRVAPYVQHPTPDGFGLLWFSDAPTPGVVVLTHPSGRTDTVRSTPVLAEALGYAEPEWAAFDGLPPPPPYQHHIRFEGLAAAEPYPYTVDQNGSRFSAVTRTAPGGDAPVRLVAYADSETEPESAGAFVSWPDPAAAEPDRRYLVDQAEGYAANLAVIRGRAPDLVLVAGDLVEVGAEQRDWDAFWSANAPLEPDSSLAASVPILAVPGNHEYYLGPDAPGGPYAQPNSEAAIRRFQTYFDLPDNGASRPEHRGRYFRLDYGPATVIGLDVSNNGPNLSPDDTNFYLLGPDDPAGGYSPGFGPGTEQYAWLETQLREAQERGRFVFVVLHHVPYSSGIHGQPPGWSPVGDPQSGRPVQALTPLLLRYGVDALLAGHDEMFERSEIPGAEVRPDGTRRVHTLQVYDVGVGGDGLRGPHPGVPNPFRRFLAHADAPEVWDGARLIDGGKHYGHLEIDVRPAGAASWEAELEPVYVFPVQNEAGQVTGFERRVYPDVVVLRKTFPVTPVGVTDTRPEATSQLGAPYPNPASSFAQVAVAVPVSSTLDVVDGLGRNVVSRTISPSETAVDLDTSALAPGLYLLRLAGPWGVRTQTLVVGR